MSIVLTDFARPRLFPRVPRGNTIQDCTAEQFEAHLNAHAPLKVLDGYAPFCKLFVYENWTSTRCLTVPVTEANRHLLRSGYEARNREELPVLVRWFEGVESPRANYLVVILYSAEQLAGKVHRSRPTGASSAASTPPNRKRCRWRRSP
jgi:hypothetical protein